MRRSRSAVRKVEGRAKAGTGGAGGFGGILRSGEPILEDLAKLEGPLRFTEASERLAKCSSIVRSASEDTTDRARTRKCARRDKGAEKPVKEFGRLRRLKFEKTRE